MAYSETRIVIRWSNPYTCCYFIGNFINIKYGIKTQEKKDAEIIEEPVKDY